MKKIFLIFVALASLTVATEPQAQFGERYAHDGERTSLFLGVQDLYWDEHENGKLLEENGYLANMGFQYDNLAKTGRGFTYQFTLGYSIGAIDYDGQTQSGIPVPTTSDYEDWRIEYLAGWRFRGGDNLYLDLLAGLGLNSWNRDINDGTAANGIPVLGYDEQYTITYARLNGGINFADSSWFHHLTLGLKYPLTTKEEIDLLEVTLEPDPKVSTTIEWRSDRLGQEGSPKYGLSIYREETLFGESPVVGIWYQPESNKIESGVRFHWYF
jgi:hypothetical protein